MPSLPSRPLAAGALTALLATAGCGASKPVAVPGTTLRLTLSEYRIAPQAVRVPAGRITVLVRNGGSIVHRLQIRSADRTKTLATSPPLAPGQQARLTLELPAGRYVDTDPLARHDTLGERGTIDAAG